MRRAPRRGVDVDITPLIDVLFMLIIFFVLTTVFVQGAITIDLPQGSASPVSENSSIVVTVTAGSEILWAGEAVSHDDLPALVADVLARSGDILLAGDRKAPYGEVARVLNSLRALGVGSVGLAFEGGGDK